MSTDIATVFLDVELRVRRFTPTATAMFALIDADRGRSITDVMPRFQNGALAERCRRVMMELKAHQEEVWRNDGSCFLLRILPYRTAGGCNDGVVITFSDITEVQLAHAQAQARERQLQVVTDSLPALIAYVDVQHRFQFVNGAYERWFNVHRQQILGEPLCEVFGPLAYDTLCPHLEAAKSGKTIESSARLRHRTLGERDVRVNWVPEISSDGAVRGFYSLIHDVTEQKQAERSLIAADVVFRNTTEAAAILDEQGRFTAINPAFESVTGYSLNQCFGERWEFLHSDRLSPDQSGAIWSSMVEGNGWRGEVWLRRKSGEVFASWMSIDVVAPREGEVRGYVAVFADISTVKEAENRLEFLAHHDHLSGLANRVMFHERVTHVLTRAGRQKTLVALLYLDLDGFKHVNDSFGHEVGDRVLVLAAERLKACVRAEDTLARLGGDEFGVLLEQVSEPWGAALVAEKIIDSLRVPFAADGREVVVGVSVGISLFPTDGGDASVLIRNADTAMYRAKERGGNIAHFYTPALTEAVRLRVSTETALRRALEGRELELYYQPMMQLGSRRIIAAEALLRWRSPGRGVLLPETFLPVAELSGLILDVGSHVIELACAHFAEMRERALPMPRLSVNVSARQCMDENFPGIVEQALRKHRVPPEAIDLEITESCFLDKGASAKTLPALKQLGVSLTIDDFGTGYATLVSLRHAPVSGIKIDRAFVDDIAGGTGDGTIVRTVVALGKSQNLRVIAEGVETQKQLDFLSNLGCDACQGYLVAPPMGGDAFRAWIEENRERIEAL